MQGKYHENYAFPDIITLMKKVLECPVQPTYTKIRKLHAIHNFSLLTL